MEISLSLLKPKGVYLRPFLFFLPFKKILKQRFTYFEHRHVETRSIHLYELATFLKYYMHLNYIYHIKIIFFLERPNGLLNYYSALLIKCYSVLWIMQTGGC